VSALDELRQAQMKDAKAIPKFKVGDTVKVHFRIVEGEKERIQIFEGTVISRKGNEQPEASFTVRRVAYGEGVERVFPLHSPRVERVEVVRQGRVRRAKLYYLRDRVGKSARIRDRYQSRSEQAAQKAATRSGNKAEAQQPAEEAPTTDE